MFQRQRNNQTPTQPKQLSHPSLRAESSSAGVNDTVGADEITPEGGPCHANPRFNYSVTEGNDI